MTICSCEHSRPARDKDPPICENCGNVVECEFSYLDGEDAPPHPAEVWHVDYHVCKRHEHIAIDNVANRRW
jgi:hypothetical protein